MNKCADKNKIRLPNFILRSFDGNFVKIASIQPHILSIPQNLRFQLNSNEDASIIISQSQILSQKELNNQMLHVLMFWKCLLYCTLFHDMRKPVKRKWRKLLPDVHFSFQAENTASYMKKAWRHKRCPQKLNYFRYFLPYLYVQSGLVLYDVSCVGVLLLI